MQKKLFSKLCVLILLVFSFIISLTACENINSIWDAEYTIMWSYEEETHTITVKSGDLYTIETLPSKEGYNFTGLYDKEEGGKQYVSSTGTCITAFNKRKNLVLYPQFTPKAYTLVLDYGEGTQSGETTFSVNADEKIPALPSDIAVGDKTYIKFAGWYTGTDGTGIKVSGTSGVSELKMDSSLRALSDETGKITLYADFTVDTQTIKFYSKDGKTLLKEMSVEYDTDFSKVAAPTEEGNKHIIDWSRLKDGSAFSGKIKSDMILYVLHYGFAVTFDANDGTEKSVVKVAEGDRVDIPVVARTGYTLLGWYDENNAKQENPIFPQRHMTITAKWKANTYQVTYDMYNEEISKEVTYDKGYALSVPTKEDYNFVGWYTADNVQLTDGKGNSLSSWNFTKDITVYAKWSKIKYQITLYEHANKVSVNRTIEKGLSIILPTPVLEGCEFLGWCDKSTGILYTGEFTPTASIKLYAKWSVSNEYTLTLDRQSCKTNNGYNPNESGSSGANTMHKKFDLIELKLSGCIKQSDGAYFIPYGSSLNIACTMLEDPTNINRAAGPELGWWDWNTHNVANDSYSGSIYGTNLVNKAVGKGAYYVKVTYTDGTNSETNATNFFADMTKGFTKNLSLNITENKTVKNIEIVFVYELYFKQYTWYTTDGYTNWRCSTVIKFE